MKKIVVFSLAMVLLAGCAKKNESGQKAQDSYKEALEDSIKSVSAEIDSCNSVATTLSDKVGSLLPEFRAVSNPHEVEGYMIFQGWEKRYPLTETGVVARLSESRQLELVAALKGGEFDRIRVSAPSVTAESDVVKYDQALNYRANGLNTVLFTGAQADSVAQLISENELNPIMVTFLNGGKSVGTWKMHNDNVKMITMTYLLYSSNKEHKRLEQESLKLGEKLKLLRQHQERQVDKESSRK
ncbi:MAG: hypothetical protein K2L89_01095 [Muribaculaceae bacterium]|nr:hypothetical protein [Muribaculaceae bacterium]